MKQPNIKLIKLPKRWIPMKYRLVISEKGYAKYPSIEFMLKTKKEVDESIKFAKNWVVFPPESGRWR